MRGTATLAVILTPQLDAGLDEFVRLCVGFVAGGGSLTLLEAGPGRGLLSRADDLPAEVERNLRGLAEFGIQPQPTSDDELHDLLRGCERVIRVADPGRPGNPGLLVIDDAYLASTSPTELTEALATAGQVLRA
ncbi:MAG: hypothetical protein QNJ90_05725 [Planctomycetota bacterium]|nr:hypothetical protein [Planctomycetota bacterium]